MKPVAADPRLSLAAVRLSDVDLGLADTLDDSELARADTFSSPALRDRFVAGRIALRLHISALTGDSPRSLTAHYSCPSCSNRNDQGHGLPGYRVPSRTSPLRVSLSRSGDWCLVAASLDERVAGLGVDLQAISSADFDGFESVAMTANERETLQNVPDARKAGFRTRLWVRKEAVLKALGTGLAEDPSRVDVAGPIPRVLGEPAPSEQWHLKDISPAVVGLPEDFTASYALLLRR
jgi:4'-phosphopantetheinyl transferase